MARNGVWTSREEEESRRERELKKMRALRVSCGGLPVPVSESSSFAPEKRMGPLFSVANQSSRRFWSWNQKLFRKKLSLKKEASLHFFAKHLFPKIISGDPKNAKNNDAVFEFVAAWGTFFDIRGSKTRIVKTAVKHNSKSFLQNSYRKVHFYHFFRVNKCKKKALKKSFFFLSELHSTFLQPLTTFLLSSTFTELKNSTPYYFFKDQGCYSIRIRKGTISTGKVGTIILHSAIGRVSWPRVKQLSTLTKIQVACWTKRRHHNKRIPREERRKRPTGQFIPIKMSDHNKGESRDDNNFTPMSRRELQISLTDGDSKASTADVF